jgi:outer membrane protein assembly factor BamA
MAVVCALAVAAEAPAQVRVDALTEVRKIEFAGVHSIPKHRLTAVLKTRTRGSAYGLRSALGKIPLVPGPGRYPFVPLTLQEDVVRLRNAYAAAGFFRTHVRYDVQRDDKVNLLDITFVIDEGTPTLVSAVTVQAGDSLAPLPVPGGQEKSWSTLQRSVESQNGRRLTLEESRTNRDALTKWWRDRGHPQAICTTGLAVDSSRTEVQLTYRIAPGPFARFGDVRVEGNQSISESAVRRQVGIEPGAPYSQAAIDQSVSNLQQLDIVRVASIEVTEAGAPDSAGAVAGGDSVLPARVRITEAERRLVGGDLGYVTDAGLSAEARWVHRNFAGGGRTLTVTGLAQTGWLALTNDPDQRYRFAVSVKQPSVITRRTSLVISPFIEHRDDTQDLSNQIGANATLVHHLGGLSSISLDYQIAVRHIEQYRFGDLASGDIGLFTFLTQAAQGLLDSLGSNLQTSTFTLSSSSGRLDNPAYPRRGLILRPALQVTAPTALSSVAYWRADVSANAFVPLGSSVVLASRVRAGRLFPFGKSLPGTGDDPTTKFLQLHDAAFTAGGTGDVRGWENRLLGPKVPDIRFEQVGDSLIPHADGYDAYGGFARATYSVELRLPVPWLGPNFGSVVFLDGGRVWTRDDRFGAQGTAEGQDAWFAAAGGGLAINTPVGPIQVSTGYKLNPSVTDVVDAEDLLRGEAQGIPATDLPRHKNRRWQFHLAIGTTF